LRGDGREHGVGLSNAPRFHQLVELSENQGIHLARFGARGLFTVPHALDAAIAFDRDRASRHPVPLRMESDRVEWAHHGAHRAGDASLGVD
jgi:hypothetical protein